MNRKVIMYGIYARRRDGGWVRLAQRARRTLAEADAVVQDLKNKNPHIEYKAFWEGYLDIEPKGV